ncbi:MAG TPA: metal-dependent hydrolase [Longimicrobium sp.]
MFIGHLPAGYLATTPLLGRSAPRERRRLLLLGLAASVLPDLDLFYFYFVDERRHVHHAYLPHLPLAWVAALGVAAVVLGILRVPRTAWLALAIVGINVLLHLVLDTVAGGIRWLWPFSDVELALTTVRARYDPWVLNFVLHWTFALEMALVVAALWRYRRLRSVGGSRGGMRSARAG